MNIRQWRGGKWMLDFRDSTGRRHQFTFESEAGARAEAERLSRTMYGPRATRRQSEITVREYAAQWLRGIGTTIKPRTLESYESILRVHLVPALGDLRLIELHRSVVKELIVSKLRPPEGTRPLSKNTCRIIRAVLHALCNSAIEDEILVNNPAGKSRLFEHLRSNASEREEKVKALTSEQLAQLLAAATPGYRSLFLTLATTGMRVGEALALERSNVDYGARVIRVDKTLGRGGIGSPKSGRNRAVDMSGGLCDALQAHERELKERALASGVPLPDLMFPSIRWQPRSYFRVRSAFRRAAQKAGLPIHLSPHSLRHTYACRMLEAGADMDYLQQQMGHSSIRLTVDLYGRWRRRVNPGVVDRLDAPPPTSPARAAAGDNLLLFPPAPDRDNDGT